MDKRSIGANAGLVWRLLDNNRRWEYNELKIASGLSDHDLNAAIGWLARENKIEFKTDPETSKEYLFLNVNVYIG